MEDDSQKIIGVQVPGRDLLPCLPGYPGNILTSHGANLSYHVRYLGWARVLEKGSCDTDKVECLAEIRLYRGGGDEEILGQADWRGERSQGVAWQ
jgi:hypothetical protein